MKSLILFIIIVYSNVSLANSKISEICIKTFSDNSDQKECSKFLNYHRHGKEVCNSKEKIYPLINEYILQEHIKAESISFIEKNKDNLNCDLFTK